MAEEFFDTQPFFVLPTAEYLDGAEWMEVGRCGGEVTSPPGSQVDEPDGLEPDPRRDERKLMQIPF